MTTEKDTRPEARTDEMLEYLDDLSESGDTNMFGAGPYLESAFPELRGDHTGFHPSKTTHEVLSYWMHTFTDRHPKV